MPSTIPSTAPSAPAEPPGRLEAVMLKWFFRPVEIVGIEELSPGFVSLTLAGPAFETAWAPGSKLQVFTARSAIRTFTPVPVPAAPGRAKIVVYRRGDHPVARWLERAHTGQICQAFGPRPSLKPIDLAAPALLFGDETSFGLASSLRLAGAKVSHMFEVDAADRATGALDALGIADATVLARRPGDEHLVLLENALQTHLDAHRPGQFILTGKAASIQRLNRALRSRGVSSSQLNSKAYWAPGKVGLD